MHFILNDKGILHENQHINEDYLHVVSKRIIDQKDSKQYLVFSSNNFQQNSYQIKLMSTLRILAIYFEDLAVVIDENDMTTAFQHTIGESKNSIAGREFRMYLSTKVFEHSSLFDGSLAQCVRDEKLLQLRKKTVLVVGSGAREHAIVTSLLGDDSISHVFVAPGNYGTAIENPIRCSNVVMSTYCHSSIVSFCRTNEISLVMVGPEQPLVDGLTNALQDCNIPCFGPSKKAAQIEASKAFSKAFMQRHRIATADWQVFVDYTSVETYLRSIAHRVVVKASGLARGKGVVVPRTLDEALDAAREFLVEGSLGDAGQEVVIEEFIDGVEVSVLTFCDGMSVIGMPPAQDFKRLSDGDQGPNTGGMGAFAPANVISSKQYAQCIDVLQRTIEGMAAEGMPFVGVLYGGFIFPRNEAASINESEPLMLEYNCRFGDPEAEVLLPLLKSPIYDICMACVEGQLHSGLVCWSEGMVAVTVVCAAQGYPGDQMSVGQNIVGLESLIAETNIKVFHGATIAGEKVDDINALSGGGRVLAVTGIGNSVCNARGNAYRGVHGLSFKGMQFRTDIAVKVNERGIELQSLRPSLTRTKSLRVAVLGSTRGTSMDPIIDAINSGELQRVEIVIVVSDRVDAGILDKARRKGIAAQSIAAKGLSREQFDKQVSSVLRTNGVDLILLIGYMRILSIEFTAEWRGRILNVHPSLLPAFAGLMDRSVHEAVLRAGVKVSGCTVHVVTEVVDAGEIVVQLTCPVRRGDTVDTLRRRVQQLESPALISAIEMLRDDAQSDSSSNHTEMQVTYKIAGVDIDAGEELVRRIKPFVRATRRVGCAAVDLGGFGGVFDLSKCHRYTNSHETLLVSGTDGVGTKLLVAQQMNDHSSIGIDLVAMCVNDVLVCGAEPLFFLDYFATGRLIVDVAAAVVQSIAQGCQQAGCVLIGGETAEMPGMYAVQGTGAVGEYDIAGFCVGAVRRSELLPKGIVAGDVVFGLPSSGLHSNGFSFVRKCIELSGTKLTDAPPFSTDSTSFGEFLLTPTTIYVASLLPLIHRGIVKGLAHITGGGILDNLPRILPSQMSVMIDIETAHWRLPPVFRWLWGASSCSQHELLRTFNCGIGMVVIVDSVHADEVWGYLNTSKQGQAVPIRLGLVTLREHADEDQVIIKGEFQ